jgi:serine/threonine-protein kinase
MTSGTSTLSPGTTFGRYVVESKLACGGMGEVWLATALGPAGFRKRVVIKTLLPHLMEQTSYVDMLVKEASLAACLNHPNIVPVFDLGCEAGVYFIAMEYLSGRTLGQVLERAHAARDRIPVRILLAALAACCDGLQHAHDHTDHEGRPLGMLHRDISPSNVMLTFSGHVALLDFGVATTMRGQGHAESGCLKGKFHYLAPERVRGEHIDRRSDIYSVGVVLFQCLTHRWPFRGKNDFELLQRIALEDTPSPRRHAPWIPSSLEKIVMRAMAREPADRYPEARALAADLRGWVRATSDVEPGEIGAYLSRMFPDGGDACAQRVDAAPLGEGIEIVFRPQLDAPESVVESTAGGRPVPRQPAVAEPLAAPDKTRQPQAVPPDSIRAAGSSPPAPESSPGEQADIFPEPTRVSARRGGDVFARAARTVRRRRKTTGPAFFGAGAATTATSWPFAMATAPEAGEPSSSSSDDVVDGDRPRTTHEEGNARTPQN